MPERRIVKLERLRIYAEPSPQDRFFLRPGSRSRPWLWFDASEMPAFDGQEGEFELERVKGGWKVLRLVGPSG